MILFPPRRLHEGIVLSFEKKVFAHVNRSWEGRSHTVECEVSWEASVEELGLVWSAGSEL